MFCVHEILIQSLGKIFSFGLLMLNIVLLINYEISLLYNLFLTLLSMVILRK